MDNIKVVFIGGLSNGKIVYDYLLKNKYVDLELVITYPDNSSKSGHVDFPEGDKIIKSEKSNKFIDKIKDLNPDFIFVAGWSELLSLDLIESAKKGTIGFHPSKLPFDKGRSVLAWQIEEGYKETALTMFYYCDVPDGGDIIGQDIIEICDNDYLEDIIYKVDLATVNLMRAYFPLLRQGLAPRIKQDKNVGSFRRLRNEKDSIINWDSNAINIYNKVRAIAPPYPGAIATIKEKKYKLLKCNIISFNYGKSLNPGTLVAVLFDNSIVVKCRDGFIHVKEFVQL